MSVASQSIDFIKIFRFSRKQRIGIEHHRHVQRVRFLISLKHRFLVEERLAFCCNTSRKRPGGRRSPADAQSYAAISLMALAASQRHRQYLLAEITSGETNMPDRQSSVLPFIGRTPRFREGIKY
ncbi:hypothetical protein EVAR_83099_1 [Eumeta japonica]|uniref:Uncharacterized protein n=1 Tax=Eumeta variegata TaxID=151549 RepID=A0A4C1WLD2_EUMVA|nr:hypothetical protein EVAR_83099_1 [Eumeta japonica]